MKPFISKNSSTKDGFVFLAVFLILFGILFFCIGMIPAAASYNKEQNWEKVPAVITHSYRRNGGSGTLQVSYEYKGTLYEDVNMKFYSDSMWEGQTITILVNPDRPTQIDNDSGTVLPFYGIFIAVGSVTFLLGLSVCISGIRKKTRRPAEEDIQPSRIETERSEGCKDTKIKIEGSELNGQKASRKGRAPHPYRNTRLTVLFLILVSIGLVLQDRATLACSVPAQATITNITSKRVKSSKKKYTVYYADVSYQADGMYYEGRVRDSYNNKWAVGDQIEICYNPSRPSRCIMPDELADAVWRHESLSGRLFTLSLAATVYTAFFFLAFYTDRKRQRGQKP